MAEYVCESYGMGVVGMKCAKCEKDLLHDHISKEDGNQSGHCQMSRWSWKDQISHVLWE